MAEKVKVLCPLGIPPVIKTTALAPRLDTLDGKTVYVVDVKFPASKMFFEELLKALKEKFPRTTWKPVEKRGSYFDDDPFLWEEIRKNADAMVMFVGH